MSAPSCPLCHTAWTNKVSNSEKNPNRVYQSCDNCYVEKPGEFWCWLGEEPKAFKVDAVRKAMQARTGSLPHPVPDKCFQVTAGKKRKFGVVEEASPPLLPRSAVDLIQDEHCERMQRIEEQYRELREILTRIEETLKKEYQ